MRKPDLHLVSETDIAAPHFQSALRRFANGVSIVTAGQGDDVTGVTVTSPTLLSIDPPRLIINLNRRSAPFSLIVREGWFGVNMLGSDQPGIADRFSAPELASRARFESVAWSPGESGVPLLKHVPAAIECEVDEIIERYSRALIVGRPAGIALSPRLSSLVFWNGQYVEVERNADLDLLAEVSIPLAHVR
jgi:flavin reductase (DIM6/NTAB) family NADH-FMN oxidoreductase RutF